MEGKVKIKLQIHNEINLTKEAVDFPKLQQQCTELNFADNVDPNTQAVMRTCQVA